MTRFDETFHEYIKYLRWGDFRELTNFMTDRYRLSEQSKIRMMKDIHISRVNSTDLLATENGNRLTGMVEIDYYVSDHAIVHQTQQQLVWLYNEEGKYWQLDSGFPKLSTN